MQKRHRNDTFKGEKHWIFILEEKDGCQRVDSVALSPCPSSLSLNSPSKPLNIAVTEEEGSPDTTQASRLSRIRMCLCSCHISTAEFLCWAWCLLHNYQIKILITYLDRADLGSDQDHKGTEDKSQQRAVLPATTRRRQLFPAPQISGLSLQDSWNPGGSADRPSQGSHHASPGSDAFSLTSPQLETNANNVFCPDSQTWVYPHEATRHLVCSWK